MHLEGPDFSGFRDPI